MEVENPTPQEVLDPGSSSPSPNTSKLVFTFDDDEKETLPQEDIVPESKEAPSSWVELVRESNILRQQVDQQIKEESSRLENLRNQKVELKEQIDAQAQELKNLQTQSTIIQQELRKHYTLLQELAKGGLLPGGNNPSKM